MASGTDLGVGLVIGHVFVTGHAVRTTGMHLRLVNVVTRATLGVSFADGHVGKAV
jgi:prepilin-type processing-associated H-X9-DG protein